MLDDLEITAYRGLYCRGCGADLDMEGYCDLCDGPEIPDENEENEE